MDNSRITIPLDELERRFRSVATTLPVIAGNEVVNFALENFRRQGFMGDTFQHWKPRKRLRWGKKERNSNRAILILRGRLRRSIRIVKADWNQVVIGSDVPYAKAHNDGFRGEVTQTVREHDRKITGIQVVKKIQRKKTTGIRFGRVQTGTARVKSHTRKIRQNMPARPFLANSPYLNAQLNRTVGVIIMKALK